MNRELREAATFAMIALTAVIILWGITKQLSPMTWGDVLVLSVIYAAIFIILIVTASKRRRRKKHLGVAS